jgi:DNA repair exonuclease SbcCD ATPase subunit
MKDIINRLNSLKSKYSESMGRFKAIQSLHSEKTKAMQELNMALANWEKTQVIFQKVAELTQQQLEYFISELVSLGLSAVFSNPYKLKLNFVVRRGKTEAELKFERNGHLFDPIDSSGGGALDIASLALRLSMWSLTNPKPRASIWLDEPFKHLSIDLQNRAIQILNDMSRKLGIQIILISHTDSISDEVNKVICVQMTKGISQIKA